MWAIAINTFRGALRERVLQASLAAAALSLLASLLLAQLALEQSLRVLEDLGLMALSLTSVATALYLGASRLGREIEDRTLALALARGLSRARALLGLYLGSLLCCALLLVLGGALLALLCLALGEPPGALPTLLGALTLCLGEAALLAAFALLFSTFSRPFVAGIFGAGLWIVGRSAEHIGSLPPSTGAPTGLLSTLAQLLPNLYLFAPGLGALRGEAGGAIGGQSGSLPGYLGPVLAYGLLYTSLALGAAALLLRRRDLG